MRVLNRIAVSIAAGQPYIDWMARHDADADKGMLTVARSRPYGAAFLLPEFEFEEDVQDWLEDNALWLFEFQLASWTEDQSLWPEVRDFRTFIEWFRVDIHHVVVDTAESDIEGEEF